MFRRVRPVAAMCLLGLAAASCGGSDGALFASQQRQRPPVEATTGPRTRPVTLDRADKVTVEFEPPAEFFAPPANGKGVVSGFQVGFFTDRDGLMRAIEVLRDAVRVTGNKVLIDVPLIPVARANESSVTIRIRALSGGPLGPWSASAGSVKLPVVERDASSRRSAAAAGSRDAPRKARQLTMASIDGHAAINASLTAALDDGLTAEEAVTSFAKVPDLAAALLLSKKLNLPFSRICKAVQAAPKRSLSAALKTVQPSLDAPAEIRGVSADVRTLLGGRRRK